jgi:hypothetical protein
MTDNKTNSLQDRLFINTPLGDGGIRAAMVNWRTVKEDVEIAMNELNEVYKIILSK